MKNTNIHSYHIKLILGLLTLVLGASVYIFLRPNQNIYFIQLLNLTDLNFHFDYIPSWLFNISTALHTYSMSLISSIFVVSNKKNYVLICLSWIFINIIFELIQEPTIHRLIYESLNTNTLGYLMDDLSAGTYDIYDIVFNIAGGVFAFTTLIFLKKVFK